MLERTQVTFEVTRLTDSVSGSSMSRSVQLCRNSISSRLLMSSFLILLSVRERRIKVMLGSLYLLFHLNYVIEKEHTEVHLDLVDYIHAVLAVDHVDSKSSFAKTSCAADPVKVCLIVGIPIHVHREVKVHHQWHLFHINACKHQNHKWVEILFFSLTT